jgi:hypothetical protein
MPPSSIINQGGEESQPLLPRRDGGWRLVAERWYVLLLASLISFLQGMIW